MKGSRLETVYETLAPEYDQRYCHERYKREDADLFGRIRHLITGVTLDVGCGTGLLLDWLALPRSSYLGLDPARAMLAEFRKKHPGYTTIHGTVAGTRLPPAETVVALYGVGSYLSRMERAVLRDLAPTQIIMFYQPDYYPDYLPEHPQPLTRLEVAAEYETVNPFGSYWLATRS